MRTAPAAPHLAAGRRRDAIRNALAQFLPAPAGGPTYPKAANPAG